MERFVGVDLGSSYTKAVAVDARGRTVARSVLRTGLDFAAAGEAALARVLEGERALGCAATGVGRARCRAAERSLTEIAALARGSWLHLPRPHTVVDIGGQDNKIVRVVSPGRPVSFAMNRKCAAGTGAFLEEIARRLELEPAVMSARARAAAEAAEIGSYCTVFTCTEIIHRIREGDAPESILRGCYGSVVKRILEMDPLKGEVALSGGVVGNHPVLAELFLERGRQVQVLPEPQFVGALGAALARLEEHAANLA